MPILRAFKCSFLLNYKIFLILYKNFFVVMFCIVSLVNFTTKKNQPISSSNPALCFLTAWKPRNCCLPIACQIDSDQATQQTKRTSIAAVFISLISNWSCGKNIKLKLQRCAFNVPNLMCCSAVSSCVLNLAEAYSFLKAHSF